MHRRYGENIPEEYQKRLDYELSVISRMGYVDYYLIVHDFINHARSRNIPVGPGRGSGAGSITAYAIGITGIDPMKYSSLFERFQSRASVCPISMSISATNAEAKL